MESELHVSWCPNNGKIYKVQSLMHKHANVKLSKHGPRIIW
jgi:hypothetical protein